MKSFLFSLLTFLFFTGFNWNPGQKEGPEEGFYYHKYDKNSLCEKAPKLLGDRLPDEPQWHYEQRILKAQMMLSECEI